MDYYMISSYKVNAKGYIVDVDNSEFDVIEFLKSIAINIKMLVT